MSKVRTTDCAGTLPPSRKVGQLLGAQGAVPVFRQPIQLRAEPFGRHEDLVAEAVGGVVVFDDRQPLGGTHPGWGWTVRVGAGSEGRGGGGAGCCRGRGRRKEWRRCLSRSRSGGRRRAAGRQIRGQHRQGDRPPEKSSAALRKKSRSRGARSSARATCLRRPGKAQRSAGAPDLWKVGGTCKDYT